MNPAGATPGGTLLLLLVMMLVLAWGTLRTLRRENWHQDEQDAADMVALFDQWRRDDLVADGLPEPVARTLPTALARRLHHARFGGPR